MAITLDGTNGITDTGNVTGGNIITGGQVVATGNITGAAFIGDGSGLTGVDATKIIDGTSQVEVIATGGNIVGNIADATVTVTHAGGFDITGDSIITGNLEVQGTTTTIDSTVVTIADLAINVANNASTSAEANGGGIKVGPVGSEYASLTWDNTNSRWDMDVPLDVNGKMNATTIAIGGTDITATAAELNKMDGVTATTAELNYVDGVTSAIQTQLDGKLTAGATSGSGISGSASSGTFTVTSNATSANTASTIVFRDGSGNFSAGVITATTTQAQYADLAEMYEADADIEPGTVVMFGGDKEITMCDTAECKRVAGVVSTDPAHLMNAAQEGNHVVPLALQGRVPCKVIGPVHKGDMMVSAGNGRAMASDDPKMGTVIGKALQDHSDGEGTIEVVIGRY